MADMPTEPEDTGIPATPADALNFALGAIDMMCVIASVLIGRGMLEPAAFQAEAAQYEALWNEKQNRSRGRAAKLFGERLRTIERTKRMATERLVVPETRQIN
jgi:hypothetical protein